MTSFNWQGHVPPSLALVPLPPEWKWGLRNKLNSVINKVTPLCGCLLYTYHTILGAASFALSIVQVRKQKLRNRKQCVDGHTAYKRGKSWVWPWIFWAQVQSAFGLSCVLLSSNPLIRLSSPGWKGGKTRDPPLPALLPLCPQTQGTNRVSLHWFPNQAHDFSRQHCQLVSGADEATWMGNCLVISYNARTWPGLQISQPFPSSVHTHTTGPKQLSSTKTFLPLSPFKIPPGCAPHASLRAIRVHPNWVILHWSPDLHCHVALIWRIVSCPLLKRNVLFCFSLSIYKSYHVSVVKATQRTRRWYWPANITDTNWA